MAKSISLINDKISKMETELKQLREQKKLAENKERAKAKTQERKNQTRRKILLGAMCLQMMKDDEQAYQEILARMDKFLIEPRDRKLFNFAEISTKPEPTEQTFDQQSLLQNEQ